MHLFQKYTLAVAVSLANSLTAKYCSIVRKMFSEYTSRVETLQNWLLIMVIKQIYKYVLLIVT